MALSTELKSFWPNEIATSDLGHCRDTDAMYDLVMKDATSFYERREEELTRAGHA